MNSKSFAFLALLATLTTTLPAWGGYTFENGVLDVNGDVDLAGEALKIEGITSVTGSGKFTNSDAVVDLTLGLENAVTLSTVTIEGNIRLVKTGDKTLTLPKDSTYAGGTWIKAGKLTADSGSTKKLDNFKPFGAYETVITVESDGMLDLKGYYNWKKHYSIVLNGGTLRNAAQTDSTSTVFDPDLTVTADSAFELIDGKVYSFAANADLDGNTLTMSLGGKLHWLPSAVGNGTIAVTGSSTFQVDKTATYSGLTLNMGAPMDLQTYTLGVKDYVATYTGTGNKGTGELQVSGAFTPASDSFYPPTMMDRSTIDLSAKEGPWAARATAFADGATIAIEVGSRSVSDGDMLVEWSGTDYNGRTFNLTSNGEISEDFGLQPQTGGLKVLSKSTAIPTAVWTGKKSCDALDPENWTWGEDDEGHPSLPDGTYVVEIAWDKLPNLNWPETDALDYASLTFTGDKPLETVALTGDRDWRGLGAMDIPFELDLKGHKLYILLPGAESTVETTVKSSVEGGELHASVAAGKTYNNTKVTLTDNLTLVKEGEGVFVQSNTAQSYTGGTRIEGGVLATPTADLSAEGVSLFGTVNKVTVAKGGALDPRGSYNWSDYTIVLDGGMISNTVANIGTNNDNTQYNIDSKNVNRRFNPNVTLLDNSTFATTKTYTFFATVDSDGHTLQNWIATDAEVRWQPKTKTGGKPLTMDVTGGGELFILKNCSLYQPTMTLKMTDGWVTMGGDMVVSNYVAASEKNLFDYRNVAAVMKVFGTFAPQAQRFIGCTMQNGSTIDLSEKKDVWSTQGFAWGKGTVDFATGATVTIDASGRELSEDMKIVEWAATPTNLDGLTFKLDEESKADGYRIKKDDAGLFVEVDTRSALTMDDVKKALPEGVVLNGETNVFTGKTAAEINEIMNTSADNGLTVKENLILGIEQEKNGKFEKKPFLKADAGAQTKEDTITFSFGGIDPKVDKANITYLIESATSVGGDVDGKSWIKEVDGTLGNSPAPATVELPKQVEPAVKYYRVTFKVDEKAVSGDSKNQ